MSGKITFQGNPLNLAGRVLKVGAIAPDFKVVAQDLKEARLSDFKDKIKIVTSFPSIDTKVCDLQVKEFNKIATGLSADVLIIGISKDLPFAQQRFCEAFEIKNIKVLSDYKTGSFGINFGLLIRELNLLARSIIILDKNNLVRYIQIVKELSSPPDYQEALNQLQVIIKNPALAAKEQLPAHCKPCEGGVSALSSGEISKMLSWIQGWQLVEDKKLVKEFKFSDFIEAKYFLDLISIIAEEQGHHPTFTLAYNKLKITLTTHAASGLTENDFIMAGIIDEL
ncbi:MAG: thiol peroxidase [Candidatus Omnitrophica bacterium]|nr:thiol peroxidase [Candidatus Omnitrophota bacterium]